MLSWIIYKLDRNKFYKLIWGTPGMVDGYGLDTDLIFNIPYYRDYVDRHSVVRMRRQGPGGGGGSPGGGPGGGAGGGAGKPGGGGGVQGANTFTEEQWYYLNTFMDLVKVTDRKLKAGRGYMQLFNLRGKLKLIKWLVLVLLASPVNIENLYIISR